MHGRPRPPRLRRSLAAALSLGGVAGLAAAVHATSFLAALAGIAALVLAAAAAWRRAAFVSVLLASALVALGAAEIVLRDREPAAEAPTVFSASYAGERYFTRSDLGVSARPGIHAIGKTARDGSAVYDVRYTIGADGFRVTPAAARPGARRINFFGCSFTFGEGISDDETLPYHVAKAGGFDVRNFGFHGYGPHQALAILTSNRDTAGAINFYLAIPWQAERSACEPDWTLHSPRYVLADGVLRRAGVCLPGDAGRGLVARILARSVVLRQIDNRLYAKARRDRSMALYLALLFEMSDVSKRRSQEFVVGFVRADWTWDYGSYSDDRLMAALRAKGIRVVDLTLSDADRRDDPKYFVHALDTHPSSLANQERARRILQQLP